MSSVSDLLAHLTPLPVQVTVQGREFTVPALDALGWLAVLTDKHAALYDVFPGMAGHEAIEFVEDLLWDGVLTTKQVDDLAYDVIAAAGDRPWWEILRIIGAATGAWHLVHVNAVVGKSLAGWLDEVWTAMITRVDPKKLTSFTSEIETPPKGLQQELNFDAEEQAFLAAMRAVAT